VKARTAIIDAAMVGAAVILPSRVAARWLEGALAVSLLITLLLGAATTVAQPALFTVHTEAAELAGHQVQVDVFLPAAELPTGVAIVAHGFTRSRARHQDLGRSLAAAGVIVVIPDLPYILDHWGNGKAIVELAHKLEAGALGLPPTERSHLVLVGTSAGGLATVLAAAKLPGLGGWVGLDPVDRTGSGIRAASQLTSPAIVLLAEPSSCNLYGSGGSIAQAAPTLLRSTFLHGASHCDFEGPTNKLCRVVCGQSSAEMRALAREETVTAVVEMLGTPHTTPTSEPESAE